MQSGQKIALKRRVSSVLLDWKNARHVAVGHIRLVFVQWPQKVEAAALLPTLATLLSHGAVSLVNDNDELVANLEDAVAMAKAGDKSEEMPAPRYVPISSETTTCSSSEAYLPASCVADKNYNMLVWRTSKRLR